MDATDGDPDFEDEPTDSNPAGSQCCIDDCEKTG